MRSTEYQCAPAHALALRAGFSLVEALVAVAILGIMGAIAIPVFGRIAEVSRQEVADNVATRINGVLITHRLTSTDPVLAANHSGTADETAMMTHLRTRDDAVPGSPLLSGTGWPSVPSSDNKVPRLRWNGRFFEAIPEGTDGVGLKIRQ
ncbi:MAG: type II secretion system protein [Verrucomicrobiales bacterium]